MEAGDYAYYVLKAEVNKLITPARRRWYLNTIAGFVNTDVRTVLEIAVVKMTLRAGKDNPKDHEVERVAVEEYIWSKGKE